MHTHSRQFFGELDYVSDHRLAVAYSPLPPRECRPWLQVTTITDQLAGGHPGDKVSLVGNQKYIPCQLLHDLNICSSNGYPLALRGHTSDTNRTLTIPCLIDATSVYLGLFSDARNGPHFLQSTGNWVGKSRRFLV